MLVYNNPRVLWYYILKMSAIEGSKSNCRDSFSSCSENIDVWSESGTELEEEIFEEQSQNALFAFKSVEYPGETDITGFPVKTDRSSDFSRLNGLEW